MSLPQRPAQTTLADRVGRRISYLRVSVTDRCDLRCGYCIPKGHAGFCERPDVLCANEFARLVGLFAELGVSRVRLTGGEPLTRADLPEIARSIGGIVGVGDVSLSTNATQLAAQAGALRAAGVRRLNVSLDSLNRQRFAAIVGRDCLDDVLRGLDAASTTDFSPVKINMVVQAGINDDEVGAMVEYCRARGFVLRLIERMPIGSAATEGWKSLQGIRQRLIDEQGLIDTVVAGGGPARYLGSRDGSLTVGFITPMSQHFCDTCNRVRLAANGDLYTCLDAAGAIPLGAQMRAGADDDALRAAIAEAIWTRPESHAFLERRDRTLRIMSVTGG